MKPAPQLDFFDKPVRFETGSEIAAGQSYIQRLRVLRTEGKTIEAVSMVARSNAQWRIHWRKRLP